MQSKSFKGKYLILCNDLGSTSKKYKVELKLIDNSTGSILKSKKIECLSNEYTNACSSFLKSLLFHECKIDYNGTNNFNVYSYARLSLDKDIKCQIIEMREINLNGKTETIIVPLAKIKLIEQVGQKYLFKIIEILDQKTNNIKDTETYYLSVD
jgi:hypothetical protein